MSGIVGALASQPTGRPVEIAAKMADAMRHDADHVTAFESIPTVGCALASIRVQGIPGGVPPIWNEQRNVCLMLSGFELSRFAACAGSLEARNETVERCARDFFTAFEKIGEGIFSSLNGWFAGILIDLRNGRVLIFNDRYGINRLYYHQNNDGFFFASEAKALLAALPLLRRVDRRGLAEFISLGCTLQGRTVFPDIHLLPPGALWTISRDGTLARHRYFDPAEWEQQIPLGLDEYIQGLRERFSSLLPRYTRDHACAAISLTGGLDSRMILAWADASPGTLPCYSFCGPIRESADVRIARRLAAATNQPYETIRLESDFFSNFGTLAEQTVYRSDGTMDLSGAVELYVNRKARHIAPVRITGNYGSEILRANVAFGPRAIALTLFEPEFSSLLDEAAGTYATETQCHRLTFIAFKQVPWHHHGRLSIEQSQLAPRSPFLDNDLVAHAYRVPEAHRCDVGPLMELIRSGNQTLASIPTDRALHYGQSRLATKLNRGWCELTAKLEYACDYGMPAWLARPDHALRGLHLERLFLGRHKFYHFRIWYKNELRDFLRESAAQMQSAAPFLRDGVVQRLVNEHINGRANHTVELHKLLSVGLLLRTLNCSL